MLRYKKRSYSKKRPISYLRDLVQNGRISHVRDQVQPHVMFFETKKGTDFYSKTHHMRNQVHMNLTRHIFRNEKRNRRFIFKNGRHPTCGIQRLVCTQHDTRREFSNQKRNRLFHSQKRQHKMAVRCFTLFKKVCADGGGSQPLGSLQNILKLHDQKLRS